MRMPRARTSAGTVIASARVTGVSGSATFCVPKMSPTMALASVLSGFSGETKPRVAVVGSVAYAASRLKSKRPNGSLLPVVEADGDGLAADGADLGGRSAAHGAARGAGVAEV